jgi:hypothetical protein
MARTDADVPQEVPVQDHPEYRDALRTAK